MQHFSTLARALFLVCCSTFFALHAHAEPRLTPQQSELDFGVIFQGEKIERTFAFHNDGDEPLKIDKVRSSCGCTATLLSTDLLQPGERGEVTAIFDSTRFRGPVKKTVYLYSNDPKRQVTQLHLTGSVRELVRLDPHRLSLGPIPAETPHVSTITLTNQGRTPLRLGSVRSSAQEIVARVEPEILEPEGTGTMTVTVTPRKGAARINAYLMVGTDSAILPEIRLPIHVQVAQPQ